MNIYTPLFLDGDKEVAGKFLVIAKTEEEAVAKIKKVLENESMIAYLLPYQYWTPFSGKVKITVTVDGILVL